MAKKETAEQKLLKIIEATKKAQDSSSGAVASSIGKKPSGRLALNIQQFNYLLVVAVVASLIYLGYEVRNGMELLQQSFSVSANTAASTGALNLFVPQTKGISYYLDKISSRNIFQPYEKKDAGPGSTTAKAALEKKMQKYKLVGVAWLDVPESATVMLEDTSNGVTRFLKEGEKLEDVTVKTIYTDRVVIGYENEEIVIKL